VDRNSLIREAGECVADPRKRPLPTIGRSHKNGSSFGGGHGPNIDGKTVRPGSDRGAVWGTRCGGRSALFPKTARGFAPVGPERLRAYFRKYRSVPGPKKALQCQDYNGPCRAVPPPSGSVYNRLGISPTFCQQERQNVICHWYEKYYGKCGASRLISAL
jgi:hypothetical protein